MAQIETPKSYMHDDKVKVRIIQVTDRPRQSPPMINDRYPWPGSAASVESAKRQIVTWVAKVAQHHAMEVPPKLSWHGLKTAPVTFSIDQEHEATYAFELETVRP